jgi:hypothetical protein
MPRADAYAITLTRSVRNRILELLEVAENSACKEHSGPNLHAALFAAKILLESKITHKMVKGSSKDIKKEPKANG